MARSTVPRCLLGALLLIAPSAAQSRTAPDASAPALLEVKYTQFTLPNGLHVILHEDHSVPMVAVNVWYHVGSANEKPGRTGFAHLFEHLMFEGSAHVKEGEFDTLLQAAGGDNNGSTDRDRTNYFMNVPSNALELALFLESDRMGYLLDVMTTARVNGQRDVVKNERRQSYENRPYGMASPTLNEMLFPDDHPYHWPTIGYMADLSAASHDDVVSFFKQYYAPGNASLVIAGDIDPDATRQLVTKWFSDIKPGVDAPALAPPPAVLTEVKRKMLTDRVQLPRLYLAWPTPASYQPGDATLDVVADVLAGGKNARLYKRLVYELQVAQDVSAYQQSGALASSFVIVATAKPGHTVDELKMLIDEELEKLRQAPPATREIERSINSIESSYYGAMERISGKADQLNAYYTRTGDPDYFAEDLARYRALAPSDIQAIVQRYLPADRRVELTVLPETK